MRHPPQGRCLSYIVPRTALRRISLWKPKRAANDRPYVAQSANHGEAVHIIAKGVYHQCKALYIITQSVDVFRAHTVAVYFYGIGIREPSPFGEGGGEADG